MAARPEQQEETAWQSMVPQRGLTVLAVDDDDTDATLLRFVLEEAYPKRLQFLHAPTAGQARTILSSQEVHLVFVDYRLGEHSGLDFLSERRAAGDVRPLIFLTGQGDERLANSALQAGADEYVCKSDLNPQRLSGAVATAFAHSENRRVEREKQTLLEELKTKNKLLEENGQRLAELYETAHHFVNDVSHEFRTPLTVIKEFTSIIRDGLAGPTSQQQNEYLEIVLDRVDDLGTMIEDMLDMSRLEAGLLGVRRKACHIQDILRDLRSTLNQKASVRRIRLDYDVGRDVGPVYGDPEKVKRIIINLVINAIKFSPDEGHVDISARLHPDQPDVVVSIQDRGPGIHPESMSLLFERFAQVGTPNKTAIKGYGLGLNICKELVHLNFGDIGVRSEVGQGSTFWFTVPVFQPATLIRRYLDRVRAFRDDVAFVSLVSAKVPEETPDNAKEAADCFLHQHIRKSDLVLALQPCQWLLVLASSQENIDCVFQRYQRAWEEAARNNPLAKTVPIEFKKTGSWRVPDETSPFVRQLELTFESARGQHA